MEAPLKPQHSAIMGVEQTDEGLLQHAATRAAATALSRSPLPSRLAQMCLLLPPLQATGPDWFSAAACVLAWQLRWLRGHAASITLVADDEVLARLASVLATSGEGTPALTLCSWSRLP